MAKQTRPTTSSGPGGQPAVNDWKIFRPAIWTVMLGIAVMLVLNGYLGIIVIGAGLGIGLKIETRRRRVRRADGATVRTRRR
jgi:hypothetical protein